jgi:hypothetical protein
VDCGKAPGLGRGRWESVGGSGGGGLPSGVGGNLLSSRYCRAMRWNGLWYFDRCWTAQRRMHHGLVVDDDTCAFCNQESETIAPYAQLNLLNLILFSASILFMYIRTKFPAIFGMHLSVDNCKLIANPDLACQ